jgi:hypothetical protein
VVHFIIKTDHLSLKFLFEQRLNHTPRHKILCKLLGLDYSIQYKKGVENVAADALSRKRLSDEVEAIDMHSITEVTPSWIEDLKTSYKGDI